MTISRRVFLARAMATAAASAVGIDTASAEATDLDVAIVGGGVSGVYAGWRLASDPAWRGKRIEVFELSRRIGGRLFSPALPGMPHLRAEAGGMRFVVTDGAATVTERLIDHLGLDTTNAPVGGDNNLFYLRGTRFRASEITRPAAVPYDLPPVVLGKSPVISCWTRSRGSFRTPPG